MLGGGCIGGTRRSTSGNDLGLVGATAEAVPCSRWGRWEAAKVQRADLCAEVACIAHRRSIPCWAYKANDVKNRVPSSFGSQSARQHGP
jgi:hypothetical protein